MQSSRPAMPRTRRSPWRLPSAQGGRMAARLLPSERGRILSRTAELIREQGERLAIAEVLDSGKTHQRGARRRCGCGALLRLLCRRRRQERGAQLPARRRLCLLFDQRAGRRHRPHRPLELSAFDRRPKHCAGACRGLHRRRQAGRADADDGADAGGDSEQGRASRRRLQCRDRHGRGGRRAAGRQSRCPAHHLHRLDRDRHRASCRRRRATSHR